MSHSIHSSRAKFRKAASFDYSSEAARLRTLGKIADEIQLKLDLKEEAKRKKQSEKAGIKSMTSIDPIYAVASKKMPATSFGKNIAKLHRIKSAK